jgi:hypothetical protein
MGDINRANISSNNNNIDDDDIIPPNFPPPPKAMLLQRSASISNKHSSPSPAINQSVEFASTAGNRVNANASTLSSNKPDLFNFTTNTATVNNINNSNSAAMMDERKTNNPAEINANNCQSSKLAYPLFFCDDQSRQLAYNAAAAVGTMDEKNSVYFYHHEPPNYLPNYDDNISAKYGTMPPVGSECPAGVIPLQQFNMPLTKVHASTCNLNNQLNSSNLISNHHFSNSLNNFNMMDTQLQNYYNFNPSFTQLPSSRGGPPFGSSSMMGSSFASNISLNGTPKNPNMPWKHRQCSSRSSSSGTNSSSECVVCALCKYIVYEHKSFGRVMRDVIYGAIPTAAAAIFAHTQS